MEEANTNHQPSTGRGHVGLVAAGVAGVALAWAAYRFVPPLMKWLAGAIAAKWLHLLCVVALVIGGGALYLLRSVEKRVFGLLECGFALVTGWYAMDDLPSFSDVDYLKLVGAAYFMLRGLTNFRDGVKEARAKTAARN